MNSLPIQCSRLRYETLARRLAHEAMLDPRPVIAGAKTAHFRAVRWKAWRILRSAGCSYLQIGKASGFDHTAVIYALNPEARRIRRDRYRAWAKAAGIAQARGEYRVQSLRAA